MAMICCESIHHPSHLNHLNHRQHQPAPQQWSTPHAQLIKATTTISSSTSASNHLSDALPISGPANRTTDTETELLEELKYPRNIKEIITSIAHDKGSFQPATGGQVGGQSGGLLFNHQVQSAAPASQLNETGRPAARATDNSSTTATTHHQEPPLMGAAANPNRIGSWQQEPSSVSYSRKTSPHQPQLAPVGGRPESKIVANFLELATNNSPVILSAASLKGSSDGLPGAGLAAGPLFSVAASRSRRGEAGESELKKDNRVGDYVNSDYENGFDAGEAAELAAAGNSAPADTLPDTQRSSSSGATSSSLAGGSGGSGGSTSGSDESYSDSVEVAPGAGGPAGALTEFEAEQDDDSPTSDSGERPAPPMAATGAPALVGAGSSLAAAAAAGAPAPEGRGDQVKTGPPQQAKTKKLRTARQRHPIGKTLTAAAPSPAKPVNGSSSAASVTASEWLLGRGDTKPARPSMGDRHLIRARHLASRFSTLIRDGNANQSSGPAPAPPHRTAKAKSPPFSNNNAEDQALDNNVGYLPDDSVGSRTTTSEAKKVFGAATVAAKNRHPAGYSSPMPASSNQLSRAREQLALKLRHTNSRALERSSGGREQLSASLESLLKHSAVSLSLPLILGKMDAIASLNQAYPAPVPPALQGSPQVANQVREYKTNYSSLFDNYYLSPQFNRPLPPPPPPPPATLRPPIRQRDLGARPFQAPNDKQQAGSSAPVKDPFLPYYGPGTNRSTLNYHNAPFIQAAREVVAQKLAPPDGLVPRPNPLMAAAANPLQYLSPAMMAPPAAMLAQQVQDEQDFGYNYIRGAMAHRNPYTHAHTDFQVSSPMQQQQQQHFLPQNRTGLHHQVDHMLANSNQLGVSHLGAPAGLASGGQQQQLPGGDSSSYSSFLDYPDRGYDSLAPPSAYQKPVNMLLGSGGSLDSLASYVNHSPQASTMSALMSDHDYRDYQSEANSYEPTTSVRGSVVEQTSAAGAGTHTNPSRAPNSRSSQSDIYYRQEPKSRGDSSSSGSGSGGGYPSRSSMASDPYEDVGNNISPMELEKDLTDLDEEFTRANFRRPPSSSSADSYMAPERYESRRYNSRRPPSSSYDTYSNDYGAGASSSVVSSPRAYYRPYLPWPAGSYYDAGADWWGPAEDYSPLASYLSPSHYAAAHYRWRPAEARYQRTYAPAANPYLASAASAEPQHMHPVAYNLMPAASGAYSTAGPLQPATETISFTLSPLAAAAAAAASALAAADKTRHHHSHWITAMPSRPLGPSLASAASSAIPGYHTAAAFYPRAANPYAAALAAASMPMYALAAGPRAGANPLVAAASGAAATAAYTLPYPYAAGPHLMAYHHRPASAASLLAAAAAAQAPLLSAASFAYPTAMRLPVRGFAAHPAAALAAFNPKLVRGPYHVVGAADLQFAETKPKPNVTNNNNNNNHSHSDHASSGGGGSKSPLRAAGAITAMAKNLTRKMFGSSSQPRPSHAAPPPAAHSGAASHQHSASTALYDFFAPSHGGAGSA